MSTPPVQPSDQLNPPSLSPLKLNSSLSSISSGHTPPNNLHNQAFTMSAAVTSTRTAQPNGPNTNGRPGKKASSNLFIPRKPARRPLPGGVSNPSTPKVNGSQSLPPSQTTSNATSSAPNAKSPFPSTPSSTPGPSGPSTQPRGISQAPPPLDAPFVEFDLLTGDINGPFGLSGFNGQVCKLFGAILMR
jgi:hypothetical protein